MQNTTRDAMTHKAILMVYKYEAKCKTNNYLNGYQSCTFFMHIFVFVEGVQHVTRQSMA